MEIRNKETLYVSVGGQEYSVRPMTMGTERNRVVYFPDITRSVSVGFPRDLCLENTQMFSVSRTMSDREISLRDALKIIDSIPFEESAKGMLIQKLSEL